jgi:hypothetical protein
MTGVITPVLTFNGGVRCRPEDAVIISAHGGHLVSIEEGLDAVCPESFRSWSPT